MNAYTVIAAILCMGGILGYITSLWTKINEHEATIAAIKSASNQKEFLNEIQKYHETSTESEIDFDKLSDEYKSKYGNNGSGGTSGGPGPSKL